MSICPTCGQRLPPGLPKLSDGELMRRVSSRPDISVYAAGNRDGSANYESWHLTYGLSKGFHIPRSQVMRLVAAGELVENYPGHDACYCTPQERRRVDALIAAREAKRAARRGR